ncbi:MAG: iron ABC transporter permease [Thermomicrobiales bacterium]|nr:iron ABC transporter permease [Thermomicrobiales bacterium]
MVAGTHQPASSTKTPERAGDTIVGPPASARMAGRRAIVLVGSSVALLVAFLLNVGVGAVSISPIQVVGILLSHAGIQTDIAFTQQQDAVLWAIRLPRVTLGLMVGGGLAISGAALQGVFRNPLAEPGLVGVTSGAAVGAIGMILLGISPFGLLTIPMAAFVGGAIATGVVYLLARQGGRTEVVTLILTGIAINAIAGAATGYLTFLASDQQLRSIVFWSLGSLGGSTWPAVRSIAPFFIIGVLLMLRLSASLNVLVLGESEARHLGVNTERVRIGVIAIAAMLSGASVAVAGIVGFIGLVVPHLIRLIAGPDHRLLVPVSAIGGAALLMMADLVARTIVIPTELPLGVVTATIGGPFFLWLLHRTRRAQGGWG